MTPAHSRWFLLTKQTAAWARDNGALMKSDREAWPRLGITESEGPEGLSGTDHNVCGAGWTAGFMAISLSLPRAPSMNPTMPPQGAPQGRALGRVTSGPQDQEGLLQLASLLPLQDNRRLSSPPRHLRRVPCIECHA